MTELVETQNVVEAQVIIIQVNVKNVAKISQNGNKMAYRKTKRISTKAFHPNAPLSFREMAIKEANIMDAKESLNDPKPLLIDYRAPKKIKSVHWTIFFKTMVMAFKP